MYQTNGDNAKLALILRYIALIFFIFFSALAVKVIYGPPRNAAEWCAMDVSARASAFCVQLAKQL